MKNRIRMHLTLARRRLACWLHNLSVRLGGPSAYHDGIPAAFEVEVIANHLDGLRVPRDIGCPDGSRWPLTTAQRISHHHLALQEAP